MKLPALTSALLREWARRYVWWKTPEEALRRPERIVRQVMNLGSFEDLQHLLECADPKELATVLQRAEAGEFNTRSWHYWHFRLGLSNIGEAPPLPVRVYEDLGEAVS